MYKVIYDNKVIDVIKYPIYLRFLPYDNVVTTGQATAHGVACSDGDTYFALSAEGLALHPKIKLVTMQEIEETEYADLLAKLNQGQEILNESQELLNAKSSRIAALSSLCKAKIYAGFTILLSDGNEHAFKLTAEDQLNLLRIEAQLVNPEQDTFIYHSTNQPCRAFSRDDMRKIINAANLHTLYHTTYFNVAKQYINTLSNIEDIHKFTYGTNLSGFVTDKSISYILNRGENV